MTALNGDRLALLGFDITGDWDTRYAITYRHALRDHLPVSPHASAIAHRLRLSTPLCKSIVQIDFPHRYCGLATYVPKDTNDYQAR